MKLHLTPIPRSPVIDLAAERLRRGERELFPAAYLKDRQGIAALMALHEIPARRLRRGSFRLSFAMAGVWLVGLLTAAGAVVVILAGLLSAAAALLGGSQ